MLLKRTLTALIGLPVIIAAVWFQQPVPWFTILIAAWSAVAAWEFYHLNQKAGIRPIAYFGIAVAILFVLAREPSLISTFNMHFEDLSMALLAAAIVIPLIWLLSREPKNQAFTRWAWTLAGIVYVGFLLSHLVALRSLQDGRNWVYFTLFVTFASDTAAFFVGRTWGRHKLAPPISPSKTWEGCIGGVLGAIVLSLVFPLSRLFNWSNPLYIPDFNWWTAACLGLVVSVFGQLGDLTESLFKRNMGVKDSGRLLPGHGGALDRMDSIVFAGIVVYYFIWLVR